VAARMAGETTTERSARRAHPQVGVAARDARSEWVAPRRVGLGGNCQQRPGQRAQHPRFWNPVATAVARRARRSCSSTVLLPDTTARSERGRGAGTGRDLPLSGLRMAGVTTPDALRMLITPVAAGSRMVIEVARGTLRMVRDSRFDVRFRDLAVRGFRRPPAAHRPLPAAESTMSAS
jgi:hypothetical protein